MPVVPPVEVFSQRTQTVPTTLSQDWTSVLHTPKERFAPYSGSYIMLFGELEQSSGVLDFRLKFGKKTVAKFSKVEIPSGQWTAIIEWATFKHATATTLYINDSLSILPTTTRPIDVDAFKRLDVQVKIRSDCVFGSCTAALVQNDLSSTNPTRDPTPLPLVFPFGSGLFATNRVEPVPVGVDWTPVFDPALTSPVSGYSLVEYVGVYGTSSSDTSLRVRVSLGDNGAETALIPIPAGNWNLNVVSVVDGGEVVKVAVQLSDGTSAPQLLTFSAPLQVSASWNVELLASDADTTTIEMADIEVYAVPIDNNEQVEDEKGPSQLVEGPTGATFEESKLTETGGVTGDAPNFPLVGTPEEGVPLTSTPQQITGFDSAPAAPSERVSIHVDCMGTLAAGRRITFRLRWNQELYLLFDHTNMNEVEEAWDSSLIVNRETSSDDIPSTLIWFRYRQRWTPQQSFPPHLPPFASFGLEIEVDSGAAEGGRAFTSTIVPNHIVFPRSFF